jgi:hypothetical protein
VYSKNAIPQLTSVTFHSGTFWYFRCPYQAKVMKTLEISSRKIVSMRILLSHSQVGGRFKRRAADPADHRGTVAARKRVGDFTGAVRTIERVIGRLCGL